MVYEPCGCLLYSFGLFSTARPVALGYGSGAAVHPFCQVTVHGVGSEQLWWSTLLAVCFTNVADDESRAVVGVWVQPAFSIRAIQSRESIL